MLQDDDSSDGGPPSSTSSSSGDDDVKPCDPSKETTTIQIAIKWSDRPNSYKDFFERKGIELTWAFDWPNNWSVFEAEDVESANAIMTDILAIIGGAGTCCIKLSIHQVAFCQALICALATTIPGARSAPPDTGRVLQPHRAWAGCGRTTTQAWDVRIGQQL
jgi:hypothetical protein